MGFTEEFNKEKKVLLSSKRPYETAAFLIFAVLFLQQFFALMIRLWDFSKNGWFNSASTTVPNIFVRVISFDTNSWTYVIAAFLALALWYFLIYLLVWRYCKNHGYARWTWTTLIVFGPSLFFMPPYIFFAVYVFRPYFFRFIKSVVEEYRAFDPSVLNKYEEEIDAQIDDELSKDAVEKEVLKKEKDATKVKKVEKDESIEKKDDIAK